MPASRCSRSPSQRRLARSSASQHGRQSHGGRGSPLQPEGDDHGVIRVRVNGRMSTIPHGGQTSSPTPLRRRHTSSPPSGRRRHQSRQLLHASQGVRRGGRSLPHVRFQARVSVIGDALPPSTPSASTSVSSPAFSAPPSLGVSGHSGSHPDVVDLGSNSDNSDLHLCLFHGHSVLLLLLWVSGEKGGGPLFVVCLVDVLPGLLLELILQEPTVDRLGLLPEGSPSVGC